jgi:hypothetical protein
MVQYCRLEVTDNVLDRWLWRMTYVGTLIVPLLVATSTVSHGLGVWTLFRPGPVVMFHSVNMNLSLPNYECAEGWMSPSHVLQRLTGIVWLFGLTRYVRVKVHRHNSSRTCCLILSGWMAQLYCPAPWA